MGTCAQEGKPCSEYPLWIFPQSVNRISNEYPRAISWISDEPEIEYWSFPSSVHQCFTSPRWSSDNFGRIEFWSKHWNLGAGDTRLPVNCIGSVSEVSQDYPLRLYAPIMCTSVRVLVSRAQNSIVCSNSIMCTKQFVICTQHTLYHVHFLSGRILLRWNIVFLTLQKCSEGICRCTHSLAYLRCLNDEADSI